MCRMAGALIVLAAAILAGCAADGSSRRTAPRTGARETPAAAPWIRRAGLVRRPGGGGGPRLRALQRRLRTLLLSRDPASGRRPARLTTTTATSTCSSSRAACSTRKRVSRTPSYRLPRRARSRRPLPQRPRSRSRRCPVVALRRRHRDERAGGRGLRPGRRDRRRPQRRMGRSVRDELRIGPPLPQQRRRDVHRRDGPRRPRGAGRVRRLGCVRRLRPRRMARPVHRQQRRLRPRRRHRLPNAAGARDYCPPETYGGLPDRLYRNRGDGTFDEVTATALRHARTGASPGPRRDGTDRRSASPPRTTTATAGSTSTWPTTAPRTCSGSTSATAP